MSTAQPSFPPEQVSDAIRAGLSQRENVAAEPGEAAALTDTYLGNLNHYRQHVQKSLADGDYRQAAEKSWGAYAQAIKLIGAEHGLHITSHRTILRVAQQLASLAGQGDAELGRNLRHGLAAARSMHTHFYENDLPDETVMDSSVDVASAIALLQELFPANGLSKEGGTQ